MGFSLQVCSQSADNLGQASLSLAFAFTSLQPGQARSRRSLGFLLVSSTSCKAVGADAVYTGCTLSPLGRVHNTFILSVFYHWARNIQRVPCNAYELKDRNNQKKKKRGVWGEKCRRGRNPHSLYTFLYTLYSHRLQYRIAGPVAQEINLFALLRALRKKVIHTSLAWDQGQSGQWMN